MKILLVIVLITMGVIILAALAVMLCCVAHMALEDSGLLDRFLDWMEKRRERKDAGNG